MPACGRVFIVIVRPKFGLVLHASEQELMLGGAAWKQHGARSAEHLREHIRKCTRVACRNRVRIDNVVSRWRESTGKIGASAELNQIPTRVNASGLT